MGGRSSGRVKDHGGDWCPVAHRTGPAAWRASPGAIVERTSTCQQRDIAAVMALVRGDKSNRAVPMLGVVPVDKSCDPLGLFGWLGGADGIHGHWRGSLWRADRECRLTAVIGRQTASLIPSTVVLNWTAAGHRSASERTEALRANREGRKHGVDSSHKR